MTIKTGLNSSKYPPPAEMCIFMQVHANPSQNKQTLKKEQAATYVVEDSLQFSLNGGNINRLESFFVNCQDKLY